MATFLIILLVLWLLWPYIMKWIQRLMARRAEDILRRMTGQPTRREERRRRRQAGRNSTGRPESQRAPEIHPARMMREVAEDVQFTEELDYSESRLDFEEETPRDRREYHERQVEDAQYTEIRKESK